MATGSSHANSCAFHRGHKVPTCSSRSAVRTAQVAEEAASRAAIASLRKTTKSGMVERQACILFPVHPRAVAPRTRRITSYKPRSLRRPTALPRRAPQTGPAGYVFEANFEPYFAAVRDGGSESWPRGAFCVSCGSACGARVPYECYPLMSTPVPRRGVYWQDSAACLVSHVYAARASSRWRATRSRGDSAKACPRSQRSVPAGSPQCLAIPSRALTAVRARHVLREYI